MVILVVPFLDRGPWVFMGFLDVGDRNEPLTNWEPILQVSPGKQKPHELKRFPPCDWNPAQNQLLNLT